MVTAKKIKDESKHELRRRSVDQQENSSAIREFSIELDAESVVGATVLDNRLMLLVKWKGCNKCEMVKADEANLKIPQLVIEYYEKRISWD